MLHTSNALASRSSASLHPGSHATRAYPRCVQRAARLVPGAWPGGSKNVPSQGYQQPAREQGSLYPQVPTYTPSEPSAPPMSDYRSSAYAPSSGGLSEADELDLQRLRGSSGAYSPEPGIIREVLSVNESLLDAIAANDYGSYKELCDEGLTCFEPETSGHLVEGLAFHKFYFSDSNSSSRPKVLNTILGPKVHLLAGGAAAVVSYTRLVQKFVNGSAITTAAAETRVWEKKNGKWVHVHFHKSVTPA